MKTALLILAAALCLISGISVFAAEEWVVVPAGAAISLMATLAASDYLQRHGEFNVRNAVYILAGTAILSAAGIANLPRKLVALCSHRNASEAPAETAQHYFR